QAIDAAGKLPWVEMAQLSLKIDYSQLQMLEYQLKQIKGRIIDQQFTDMVSVVIELPAEHLIAIREQFSS
ncbi:MAG TPA: YigZ family protein, partial [Methylophaga sp.]|nr:YigZ family protein [Methylophaga sp.]